MTPHVEVVTLAVFLLGGEKTAIDTEDVAKMVHELAPGRFSWRKYPDQINLEMVRVSLSDAKKETNGNWIDGSGRTGWTLTETGRNWARTTGQELIGRSLERPRAEVRSGSIDERRWRQERGRITSLDAWARWTERGDVSEKDALEVFRVDAYSVGQLRSRKITRLASLFDDDKEIGPFIRQAASVLAKENTENG